MLHHPPPRPHRPHSHQPDEHLLPPPRGTQPPPFHRATPWPRAPHGARRLGPSFRSRRRRTNIPQKGRGMDLQALGLHPVPSPPLARALRQPLHNKARIPEAAYRVLPQQAASHLLGAHMEPRLPAEVQEGGGKAPQQQAAPPILLIHLVRGVLYAPDGGRRGTREPRQARLAQDVGRGWLPEHDRG